MAAELEPVIVGGYVVSYRPADEVGTKKTSAKKAAKKQATTKGSASTAEEATK